MTTYLVDNSIWRRAGATPAIARRLREISSHDLLLTCPPQVLDYCRVARSAAEYTELRADMDRLRAAWRHPAEADALDIQQALRDRTAESAACCLIAAYGVVNDAVVLNADRTFRSIEIATRGAARQEFIAA